MCKTTLFRLNETASFRYKDDSSDDIEWKRHVVSSLSERQVVRYIRTTRRLITCTNDSSFEMPDDTPFASNSERQCTRHKRHAVWNKPLNDWSFDSYLFSFKFSFLFQFQPIFTQFNFQIHFKNSINTHKNLILQIIIIYFNNNIPKIINSSIINQKKNSYGQKSPKNYRKKFRLLHPNSFLNRSGVYKVGILFLRLGFFKAWS